MPELTKEFLNTIHNSSDNGTPDFKNPNLVTLVLYLNSLEMFDNVTHNG